MALYTPSVVTVPMTRKALKVSPGGIKTIVEVAELTVTEATRTSVCALVFVEFVVRRLYGTKPTVESFDTCTVKTQLPDVIVAPVSMSDTRPALCTGIQMDVAVAVIALSTATDCG